MANPGDVILVTEIDNRTNTDIVRVGIVTKDNGDGSVDSVLLPVPRRNTKNARVRIAKAPAATQPGTPAARGVYVETLLVATPKP